MSKKRLVVSYVLTAAALAVTVWFGIASFPLEASPMPQAQQPAATERLIRVELAPRLAEPVRSNLRARLAGFQGRPDTTETRKEVFSAVKEIDPTARISTMWQSESADGSLMTTFIVTVGPMEPIPSAFIAANVSPSMLQATVQIDFSRLPEPKQSLMRSRLAPYEGRQYTPELFAEIRQAAREVDPNALVQDRFQRNLASGSSTMTLLIFERPEPAAPPPPDVQRIPVGGSDQAAKLINQPVPAYPPLAMQARIQGTVRFTAIIGIHGRVAALTLISGHPLLVSAAQEAVKQYVYEPTLLNGKPVEVVTEVDVSFNLM